MKCVLYSTWLVLQLFLDVLSVRRCTITAGYNNAYGNNEAQSTGISPKRSLGTGGYGTIPIAMAAR